MQLPFVAITFFLSMQYALCSLDETVTFSGKQLDNSWSDNARKKADSKQVIVDNEKTSKEGKSSYNREEKGLNGLNVERNSYDEQDRVHKGHDAGRQSLGESELSDRSKNSFERHGSGYFKKGHHRTGFTNNYHKDESGNNSSFYEDSDDEDGRRSSENNGGYYGRRAENSFVNGQRDASFTGRDRTEKGLHDNRENFDNYRQYMGGLNNNRYDDNKKNYFLDEAGRYYDRDGQEIYYKREHFTPLPYNRYNSGFLLHKPYYKDDLYPISFSRDYRYFPDHDNYYDREFLYPKREYRNNYHDDMYESGYYGKYGRIYGPYDRHGRY